MAESGYDATLTTKKRRKIVLNLRHEDAILAPKNRDLLISEARNLRRNSSIVAWAVRTHLDNVAKFTFQCRTGKKELDSQIEWLMGRWQSAANCDVTRRHSFDRLTKLAEEHAFVEGDVFVYLQNTGHIQVIEGDRVRTPTDLGKFTKDQFDAKQYRHGVKVNEFGEPVSYAVCDRNDGGGFVLGEIIDAVNVLHHGYFDRNDQGRGITQLAGAVNTFKDLYEASDYALNKMKIESLFAMKINRGEATDPADGQDDISIDLESGSQILDFTAGDDAEFMTAGTPSAEFQSFHTNQTQAGLKGIDIPFSFYDESHTNYSGARLANVHYGTSAEDKRENLRKRLLNPLTIWLMLRWVADGELVLPADMTVDDIPFEWVGASLAAIDPQKEAAAKAIMLSLGLTSKQRLCKEDGEDYFQIQDERAAEEAYASKATTKDSSAADAALVGVDGQPEDQTDAPVEDANTPDEPSQSEPKQAEARDERTSEQDAQIVTAAVLNGAQITAVIEIVEKVRSGIIPAVAAVELLVAAGMERPQAEKIVKATTDAGELPTPQPLGEAA